MNKKYVVFVVLLAIIGGLIIIIPHLKQAPEEQPLEIQNITTTDTEERETKEITTPSTNKVVTSEKPNTKSPEAGWKVVRYQDISLTVPSEFKDVASTNEDTISLFLGIDSENIESYGSIMIGKFTNQTTFNEMTSGAGSTGEVLIDANYPISGVTGKYYSAGEGVVIIVPSKRSMILITPGPKGWKNYTESDINKIIRSIKL